MHSLTSSIVEFNSCLIYTSLIFRSRKGIISSSLTSCLISTAEFYWISVGPKISCLLKVFSTKASSPELKTWRNGKSAASHDSLFHWLITLTVEQLCLISLVKCAWPQPLVTLSDTWYFFPVRICFVIKPPPNLSLVFMEIVLGLGFFFTFFFFF